jgi:hypothetical protein
VHGKEEQLQQNTPSCGTSYVCCHQVGIFQDKDFVIVGGKEEQNKYKKLKKK